MSSKLAKNILQGTFTVYKKTASEAAHIFCCRFRINQNNFCYLILKEDFAPNHWVSPKEMEGNGSLPMVGNHCFLTGWQNHNQLSSINVTITESKHCEQRYGPEKFMASDVNMVCAKTMQEVSMHNNQWLMAKTIVCNGKIAGVLNDVDCDTQVESTSTLIPFTR